MNDRIREHMTDSELLGKKQHQWVSLTDEEIKKILGFWSGERRITAYTRLLFDKIDEVLKRKNT